MLKTNAKSSQAELPQKDGAKKDIHVPHLARTDSSWAQGLREVRLPQRVLCFYLAADLADARRRRRSLPKTDFQSRQLRAYARFLKCRLNVLDPSPDQADEIRFHFAALNRGLEQNSGRNRSHLKKHAARLLELIPGGSPEELIVDITERLAREADAEVGILTYSPELYFVFRKQGADLELTEKSMSQLEADNLLSSLNSGLLTWSDLETTNRSPVYCHPIKPSGYRLWIELDQMGFWVLAGNIGGCYVFNLPFPCFEEAQYFIEGSLTADLMIGAFLGSHWTRQDSE